MSDTVNHAFTVLGTLALIALVIVAAYWCARLMGRSYGSRAVSGSASSMRILERLPLGTDSSLLVVRVGKEVLLLGATQQRITYLRRLDPAQYPEDPAQEAGKPAMRFSDALKTSLRNAGIVFPGKSEKRGADK